MPDLIKREFLGGIASQFDPTKSDPTKNYYLGVNIRIRKNVVTPVSAPLEITDGLPDGKRQGIYAFDKDLLVFVGGNAYYKIDGVGAWLTISNLAMSPTVDEIDVEAVPSSSLNFVRTATTSTTQADNEVVLGNPIASSPQCLIVMDGVSQNWAIFPDATARRVKTYDQWTPEDPEYVPIGRYPKFVAGILYCMGKDKNGKLTQMYRSVSGRPLDFVILLDASGNKIDPDENLGGAPALANRVSYSPVTNLSVIETIQNGFLATTSDASYVVVPNYDRLIAAEPTFDNVFVMPVGAVSKNAVVPVLGDTAVICKAGIRSFNGVQMFKWQGKNAPFSRDVNNFIANHIQTGAAAISFDNYAFFSLDTVYGQGVLVYDMLIQNFVSLDIYAGFSKILQFAVVQSGVVERLYAYTSAGEIIQLFGGGPQRAQIYLTDLSPSITYAEHRAISIDGVWSNILTYGYATAIAYTDHFPYSPGASALYPENTIQAQPINLPYNVSTTGKNCQALLFNFQDQSSVGWRVSAGLMWDNGADLLEIHVGTVENKGYANDPVHASNPIDDTRVIVTGSDNDISLPSVAHIRSLTYDYVFGTGNHTDDGSKSDISTLLVPHWDVDHLAGKFFAAPGVNELITVNGEPFYDYLLQGPEHYSKLSLPGGIADIFFITAGWDETDTQIEPSNLTNDGVTIDDKILNSQQMQWLRLQLEASTAKYKIVFWYNAVETSNPNIVTHFENIPLKSWGADLLITGGGGMYERLVDSVGMVTVNHAVGGASLYTGSVIISPNSKHIIQGVAGYTKLVINPLRLEIRFYDLFDNLLDFSAL